MKNLVIIGSTGSVGRQVIEVLEKNPGYFKVLGLAAKGEGGEIEILSSQIKEFSPKIVSLAKEETAKELSRLFPRLKIYCGKEGLLRLCSEPSVETAVFSASGMLSLRPLLEAIKKRKRILLANKEILIAAGEIINRELDRCRAEFIPLDSEHSAIFQCLKGENRAEVKNLILTCSGGPFRNSSQKELEKATIKDVLSHPVWSMGPKITVDSATLLNKGFEVLEAHFLFRFPFEKIKILIHPQSVIHSMVEFQDGSLKALLSLPDMRLPIQYALFHPRRPMAFLEPLDLAKVKNLSFFEPDAEKFPCLKLAFRAGQIGGTMPAVLVFADEFAVSKFLKNEIRFLDIPKIISRILDAHQPIKNPKIEDILALEEWVKAQMK